MASLFRYLFTILYCLDLYILLYITQLADNFCSFIYLVIFWLCNHLKIAGMIWCYLKEMSRGYDLIQWLWLCKMGILKKCRYIQGITINGSNHWVLQQLRKLLKLTQLQFWFHCIHIHVQLYWASQVSDYIWYGTDAWLHCTFVMTDSHSWKQHNLIYCRNMHCLVLARQSVHVGCVQMDI